MVRIEVELSEKEYQDLMSIWMFRQKAYTKSHIFREKQVAGSVADFVIFSPYQPGTIYVYELKMYYDKDKKRLIRQLKDYLKVADYVYLCVFGGAYPKVPEGVTQLICNIKNGRFNVQTAEEHTWTKENPKENIDKRLRVKLMKDLIDEWNRKAHYATEIMEREQRRIIKEEKTKKNQKHLNTSKNV